MDTSLPLSTTTDSPPTTPKGAFIQKKPETSPRPWPPQSSEVFTPANTPQAMHFYANKDPKDNMITRLSALTVGTNAPPAAAAGNKSS
jgi:hypothetical protein